MTEGPIRCVCCDVNCWQNDNTFSGICAQLAVFDQSRAKQVNQHQYEAMSVFLDLTGDPLPTCWLAVASRSPQASQMALCKNRHDLPSVTTSGRAVALRLL